MALISIILPTFNRDQTLIKSIESVINQLLPNWELIIWDDGSTDNSKEFIASFNDPRFSYYYSENKGAAAARNSALRKAKGNLIAFLDSDDEWLPQKLSEQVKVFKEFPQVEFLFTDFMNFNIKKNIYDKGFAQNKQTMQKLTTFSKGNDCFLIDAGLNEALARSNFIALDSVILRREVLERVGLFNESLRNSEDLELWWRMGLAGVRFAFLNKVLLNRYKPPDSLSGPSILAGQNTLKALDICKQSAMEKGRIDLVKCLRGRYRNTWQNLILAYGLLGERKNAVDAFFQSVKFGLRPGSVRLLSRVLLSK